MFILVGTILWVIAAVFLLQGFLVLLKPGHIHRRVFYMIATFFGAMWSIGIASFLNCTNVEELEIAFKVLYASSDVMIWAFLAFSLYITNNKWRFPITVISGIISLAVVIWIVIFNGTFLESLSIGSPNTATLKPLPYTLYALYFVIYSVTIIGVLARGYFSSKQIIEKKRIGYIIIAFVIAASIGMLFSLILPWVGNYNLIWIGPIGIVLFAAIIHMAVVRYRLFGVSFYVARMVLLIIVALAMAFIYAMVSSWMFSPDNSVTASSIVAQMLAALVFVCITYLLMRLSFRSSRRWFRRGLLDDRLLDEVFHAALVASATKDVLNGVGKIVANHISDGYAVTAVTETDTNSIVVSSRKAFNQKAIKMIDKIMNSRQKNVMVTEEIPTADEDYDFLRENHISAVARVRSADNDRLKTSMATYLIICCDKATLYSDAELSVLLAICNIMSLTLENTLYYDKIQNFNKELEEHVDTATASLRSANRKLKKLYKAEDDFIAMASHQLRTPLTSIRGYLSMLLEGDFGKITDEQRHVLNDVYTSSERMVFLISDFLDVSRLQTGKFELQRSPTRLDEILAPEIQQMQIPAELRQIKIDYAVPSDLPLVNGDRDKLRQVMVNMIDNAIFYSHAGGHVTISLHKHAGQVIFTVRDTGIGVPRVEQSKLFTKFFRASNARNIRPDGTGVGLFMVRKVIVAHGGSLIFESQEGKGSTFGFRLPIIDPPK